MSDFLKRLKARKRNFKTHTVTFEDGFQLIIREPSINELATLNDASIIDKVNGLARLVVDENGDGVATTKAQVTTLLDSLTTTELKAIDSVLAKFMEQETTGKD